MRLSRDNGRQEAGYPAFWGTPGLNRPVVIMLRSAPQSLIENEPIPCRRARQ